MKIDLSGKRAVVTGGSRGIGRAIALACAEAGAAVSICARGAEALDRVRGEIAAHGVTAHAEACDIADAAAVAAYIGAAAEALGGIDILVNNASGFGSSNDEAGWARSIDVDLLGTVRATWAAVPFLTASRAGAIVNISSISALRPRGLTTYTTSKAAVIGLTQAMAVDHGRDNIRVNCICPGPMYTPMVYAHGMSEAARAQRAKASVLKIEGTGWDVGHAVKFLLSNHARYITGQVLVVDGGVTLQGPERDSRDH